VSLKPPLYDAPMSNAFRTFFARSLFILTVAFNASALADDGMWLFSAPPLKQIKEKYQFEPTPQWLEHLQKASVRFNSGGSGSFVSANGLVITNHHVGADTLQKISDEQNALQLFEQRFPAYPGVVARLFVFWRAGR
jgi:S1-C subfamily serine protease